MARLLTVAHKLDGTRGGSTILLVIVGYVLREYISPFLNLKNFNTLYLLILLCYPGLEVEAWKAVVPINIPFG